MAAVNRIYRIKNEKTGEETLVNTYSASRAHSFVASSAFSVSVASQEDLVRLVGAGVKVQTPEV